MFVGDTQYDSAPEVLTLLKSVIREHPDAIGYMSLVEDAVVAVTKTPKPKAPKGAGRGKIKPNAELPQSDEPEAKSEQPPVKPPHLEVLRLGPVRPEVRAAAQNGAKLIATLTVRGDIWGLMTTEQRKLALLTLCLAHKVTVPEDGGEPKIGKAPLPIQTHPYVVQVGGAWWEGLDPCAAADGADAAAVLLGDDEAPRRTLADLPPDAVAEGSTDGDDEPY